jgi:hypothetical protein
MFSLEHRAEDYIQQAAFEVHCNQQLPQVGAANMQTVTFNVQVNSNTSTDKF